MITIKKPEEIKAIRAGGKILAGVLKTLTETAKAGMTTGELDELAEKLIIEKGGVPAFKNYCDGKDEPPFPSTICASVNEQLVHTPAGSYVLKNGDILSIDIGMKYPAAGKGFYTDMAVTIPIGETSAVAKKVMKVTRQALNLGLAQVKAGNKISDIGKAIQPYVEGQGFSVVRRLVGHGVGYAVHEEPRIPNYHDPKMADVEMKAGMVLAIEPMVNVGHHEIKTGDDGWTVTTADEKLCAHFEHTVAVTEDGCDILTLP